MLNNTSIKTQGNMITLPFLQFDKIYKRIADVSNLENDDGVFINRFVFVEENSSVWMKQYKSPGGGYYIFITSLLPDIPYSNYGMLQIGSLDSDKPGIIYGQGRIYDTRETLLPIEIEIPVNTNNELMDEATFQYVSFYTEIELALKQIERDSSGTPIAAEKKYEVKLKIGDGSYSMGVWIPFGTNGNYRWVKLN